MKRPDPPTIPTIPAIPTIPTLPTIPTIHLPLSYSKRTTQHWAPADMKGAETMKDQCFWYVKPPGHPDRPNRLDHPNHPNHPDCPHHSDHEKLENGEGLFLKLFLWFASLFVRLSVSKVVWNNFLHSNSQKTKVISKERDVFLDKIIISFLPLILFKEQLPSYYTEFN